MRAVFVLAPAIFLGVLVSLLNPVTGIAVLIATIYLGVEVTKARPERGEK